MPKKPKAARKDSASYIPPQPQKADAVPLQNRPINKRTGNWRVGNPTHPDFIANQWQPGQSGNPGGRPKDLTLQLKKQLAMKVPNDPEKRSYAQLLIEAGVKRAISKSDVLFKEIFDRIEGKLAPDEEQQNATTVKVVVLDIPRPPLPAAIQRLPGSNGDKKE